MNQSEAQRPYPPMPKPIIVAGGFPPFFTAADMRAYVDADRAQAPVADQPAEPSPAKTPGFESLRLWWVMHETQWELCGERPADDAVVLQFMGSGASHMVTAGQIRQALDVTDAPKGDSNGTK